MSRGELISRSNLSTLCAGESPVDVKKTEQHNSRGHDGSFQAPGGSTYSLESGVKRLQIAGQVLQTVMAETMQVPMTKLIFMTNLDADLCGLGKS